MNKSQKFTPGFISVLHTFGRDLKWNPHIHCLISEGGLSDDNFWRKVTHFNYTFLRFTIIVKTVSMFMQNQIFVILKQLLNTLSATWDVLLLLLPESIPTTEIP